jgi:hypothetical protein
VVISHKAQVCRQAGESIPCRERLGLDHEAAQRAGMLDERIDLGAQRVEVAGGQGALRNHEENALRLVEMVLEAPDLVVRSRQMAGVGAQMRTRLVKPTVPQVQRLWVPPSLATKQ